jgi:hypothetical protein
MGVPVGWCDRNGRMAPLGRGGLPVVCHSRLAARVAAALPEAHIPGTLVGSTVRSAADNGP